MPNESLRDIERRVAEDRAELARTLDLLGKTLAPERLKTEAAETANRYGSELGGQLWATARQNPAACAMVGTGLALLLSGAGKREDRLDDPDNRATKTAPTPDRPSASRMRAAIDSGLDSLPSAGRRRVLRAREAAISAQDAVERRAARTARQADRITRENPVATGAAAFGLGALIAALLPSTRQEDEMLGAKRDALMTEARKALQAELSKLERAAQNIPTDRSAKRNRDLRASP